MVKLKLMVIGTYFDQKDGHMLTGFQYLADEKLTCYYNPATGQMEYGQPKN